MPFVQPVLRTVTLIYIYIYIIIVGKSMPIGNYEQYKRVINHITGRLYMHVYIYIYIERERERERERETLIMAEFQCNKTGIDGLF